MARINTDVSHWAHRHRHALAFKRYNFVSAILVRQVRETKYQRDIHVKMCRLQLESQPAVNDIWSLLKYSVELDTLFTANQWAKTHKHFVQLSAYSKFTTLPGTNLIFSVIKYEKSTKELNMCWWLTSMYAQFIKHWKELNVTLAL